MTLTDARHVCRHPLTLPPIAGLVRGYAAPGGGGCHRVGDRQSAGAALACCKLSLGYRQLPSDRALRAMNRVHRILLGASGGRLGWRFSGMPVIELTTTGRKSGQPRTTMLTSPYQEDSAVVVVASRGGDDKDPPADCGSRGGNCLDRPRALVGRTPQEAEAGKSELNQENRVSEFAGCVARRRCEGLADSPMTRRIR